jgi:hypothetical protein
MKKMEFYVRDILKEKMALMQKSILNTIKKEI